jgi:hypothetical protein
MLPLFTVIIITEYGNQRIRFDKKFGNQRIDIIIQVNYDYGIRKPKDKA